MRRPVPMRIFMLRTSPNESIRGLCSTAATTQASPVAPSASSARAGRGLSDRSLIVFFSLTGPGLPVGLQLSEHPGQHGHRADHGPGPDLRDHRRRHRPVDWLRHGVGLGGHGDGASRSGVRMPVPVAVVISMLAGLADGAYRVDQRADNRPPASAGLHRDAGHVQHRARFRLRPVRRPADTSVPARRPAWATATCSTFTRAESRFLHAPAGVQGVQIREVVGYLALPGAVDGGPDAVCAPGCSSARASACIPTRWVATKKPRRRAGIPVKNHLTKVYVISALMAAVAGRALRLPLHERGGQRR